MSDATATPGKNRPAYSWWVIPTALFLMILMSALGPHLLRKRIIGRLESLGAKVERSKIENWFIPIDRLPGLQNLSKLPVWLRIDAHCTSAQCAEIFRIAPRLPSFRELDLSDSATIDENLEVLQAWSDLQKLSLSNTQVTNNCLQSLRFSSRLTYLNLSNCDIDDAGIERIAQQRQLEQLELTGTKITDAGLRHLKSLKGLRVLGLSNTQVSETGIEDLMLALPDLHVTDD